MNNMDSGNMQGMGIPMQGPMQGQQNRSINQFLVNSLRQTPVPPGWQQTVRVEDRYPHLNQLATAFQLAVQNNDPADRQRTIKLIQTACDFEKQAFTQAPNREMYQQIIGRKLTELRAARQRIMDNLGLPNGGQQPQPMQIQQNMGMQMNGMGMNQNGFNAAFPTQLQQNMQAAQQMMMQANQRPMQAGQQSMPQQMIPQQGIMPQQGLPQQTLPQQFQQQQRPGPPMQNPNPTPNEQAQINRMAEILLEKAKQSGELHRVHEQLANIPLQQRQLMAQGNIDPIQQHFRRQAATMYQRTKQQNQFNQQNAQGLGQPQNGIAQNALGGMRMVNGQGLPPNGLPFDVSPFMMQQAEAQRSQEAGDTVVPVSSLQNGQFPALGGLSNLQNAGIARPNQAMNNTAQQVPPADNAQTRKAQGNKQLPRTPQLTNARAKANAKGQTQTQPQQKTAVPLPVQNQLGGLHPPQPNLLTSPMPTMPNLNQPLAPASDGQRSVQQTPQQPPLEMSQMTGRPGIQGGNVQRQNMNPQLNNMPNVSNVQFPAKFPVEFRDKVLMQPPEKQRAIFQQWQQKQQAQQMQNAAMNPSLAGQQQMGLNNQSGQQNQMPGHGQGMVQQPTQQQNFQNASQQPNNNNIQNQQQARQMQLAADSMTLPKAAIKGRFPNFDIPEQVKAWGPLKQWIQQNRGTFETFGIELKMLLQIQSHQFSALRKNQQQRQQAQEITQGQMQNQQPQMTQSPQQVAQMHQQQYQPNQVPPPQMPVPQNQPHPPPSLPDMSQMPAMPVQRQQGTSAAVDAMFEIVPQLRPTPQDIFNFREQVGPRANNISDSNIYTKLLQERLRQLQGQDPALWQQVTTHLRAVQQAQQQQNIQSNNMQMQNQSIMTAPAAQMVGSLPQLQQPQQTMMPNQQAMFHTMVNGQGGMLNGQPNLPGAGAPNPYAGIQPDQIAHLSPEQRANFEAARLRQAMQPNGRPNNTGAPIPPSLAANMSDAEKEAKFNQIIRDVQMTFANMPPAPLLNLPLDVKRQMVMKCQQVLPMVGNIEKMEKDFWMTHTNEPVLRETLSWCNIIRRQQLKEMEFTIDPKELTMYVTKIQKFFAALALRKKTQLQKQQMALAEQRQQQQQQSTDTAANVPHPSVETATVEGPPTKAAAKSTGKAGAAGQSPFVTTGHGTPLYSSVTNFQPDKLAIVPKRKRKGEQDKSASATPAQTQMSPTASTAVKDQPKVEAVKIEETPSRVVYEFKCPLPHCDTHAIGFETQAEADKHAVQIHDYKDDALEWCLKNMRSCLGLDANGKPSAGTLQVTPAVKSAEQKLNGITSTKLETALSMSRAATQPGIKREGTPAVTNNLLQTPQPGFKPGSPEANGTAMKRTHSALTSGAPQALPPTPSLMPSVPTAAVPATPSPAKPPTPFDSDPWTASLVDRNALSFAFADIPGFRNPLADAPSPPPPALGHGDTPTPESMKSNEAIGTDGKESAGPALQVDLDDWDPFVEHKGLNVQVRTGSWGRDFGVDVGGTEGLQKTSMSWEERYGARAGLNEDVAKLDLEAWMKRAQDGQRVREQEVEAAMDSWVDFGGGVAGSGNDAMDVL